VKLAFNLPDGIETRKVVLNRTTGKIRPTPQQFTIGSRCRATTATYQVRSITSVSKLARPRWTAASAIARPRNNFFDVGSGKPPDAGRRPPFTSATGH